MKCGIIVQAMATLREFNEPRTMLQVSRITGIERANICWYIRVFRERNLVFPAYYGNCPISNSRALFYTTNPNFWQKYVPIELIELMTNESQVLVCTAIRDYFHSWFDPTIISLPPKLEPIWRDRIQPRIEKEVGIWRK